MSGLAEARERAQACGIELIDGVEISVTWRGHTVHVVGLMIDPENDILLEGLHANRSGRDARAERMSRQLEAVGIPDVLRGAQAYVTNPELVSRTHFARYLVESGREAARRPHSIAISAQARRATCRTNGRRSEQALGWILAAGGLPVLAHPADTSSAKRHSRRCLASSSRWAEWRSKWSQAVTRPISMATGRNARVEFGLLASVGSDFHGGRDVYRDLGELPPLPSACKPVWTRF